MIEQPASRSYGIEVARLAGLPETVVTRARQILANLEMGELDEAGQARLAHRPDTQGGAGQLGLFTPAERRVIDELRTLEIERLTPIEALNALARALDRLKPGGDQ